MKENELKVINDAVAAAKSKKYKVSDETRRKMSIASKGKKKSKEHAENIRKANLGKRLTTEHRLKLSLAKKGKPMSKKARDARRHPKSLEARLKASNALKGSKSCKWKGGITQANQIIRCSLEYRLWREAVFKRDNWTCIWCGARSAVGVKVTLHADHIKPFAYFPELRFAIDNGRTLCINCHKKTDTYAGGAQKIYG